MRPCARRSSRVTTRAWWSAATASEHILGVLQKGDLLKRAVPGQPIGIADIEAVLHLPLYVPGVGIDHPAAREFPPCPPAVRADRR